MNYTILRMVGTVSGWFPDISGISRRKQISGALLLSVGVHLLLFVLIALASWLIPEPAPLVKSEPRVIEIEFVPTPFPEPEPEPQVLAAAPETPPVIESEGLEESAVAPRKKAFQSSQDMVAGSEREGQGLELLPSQSGADLPFTQFKTQTAMLSKTPDLASAKARTVPAEETPPAPAPEKLSPAPPPESPPELPPEPSPYKVKPLPKEYLDAMAKVEGGAKPLPEALQPAPDPADAILLPEHGTQRIKPEPVRSVALPQPEVAPAQLVMPPARPEPIKEPGYQPEMRQTRVEGNITNRGKPGVDAIKTPLGVYRKNLSAQIQARWQYYTKQRMDMLALGTVRIRFFVSQDGRAQDIEVIESNSNQSFTDVCEQSVREAKLPAPPGELELMKDGRLELVFSFTLYSAH